MVMRLMGQVYGYAAATMPMIGQVKTEEKQGSRWVVGDGSKQFIILLNGANEQNLQSNSSQEQN